MIKIAFIVLGLLANTACTKKEAILDSKDDQHSEFVQKLGALSSEVLNTHGACKEWSTTTAPEWFKPTETGSPEQLAGRYHQLQQNNKSGLDKILSQFQVRTLSRHQEYELYNLPLRYPTSDRNIQAFIETTHSLPECDTTFVEYSVLDALLDSKKFGPWDAEVKLQIKNFIIDYLQWTLTQKNINYGNILTNAALMRSMAEYEELPKELVPALDLLLNEAETYHRQSMESFRRVAVSENKPSVSEYRSILVLHREREEKAQHFARTLAAYLERALRAQATMDR